MPVTYEPIITTTLGGPTSSFTISNIPSTYTDLKLIVVTGTSASGQDIRLRLNSDTGTNYSQTNLYGNGSIVGSNRFLSSSWIRLTDNPPQSVQQFFEINLFSYAGSTNKTLLITDSNNKSGSGQVWKMVGLWRNTSAITSITILANATDLLDGTIATLYGIKAA